MLTTGRPVMNSFDYKAPLAALPAGIVITDDSFNIQWCNHYFKRHYDRETKAQDHKNIDALSFVESDVKLSTVFRTLSASSEQWSDVLTCYTTEHEKFYCRIWANVLDDERRLFYFERLQSTTKECDALLQLTRYDQATQLPNRAYFLELLAKELYKQEKVQTFLSVLVIDFDELDYYDALFDYDVVDVVSLELKNRLTEVVKEGTLFAKIGSSKFALLYETQVSTAEVEKVAEEILHLFAEPLSVQGHLAYVELSIGISQYPTDTLHTKALLQKAEKTASFLKATGSNSYDFAHRLPEKSVDHILKISTDLPAAVENEEIYFVFQPQYCHKEGRYCGAELLARWNHPELGAISPETFIPIAEQTGMIRAVTMKAFMEAATLFERLEQIGIRDFSLSVNISPSMLLYSNFIEDLSFFVECYHMVGKPLQLEVTENDLARNVSKMVETLQQIRAMGIKVEMDDYGTGYTSLQYLSRLPLDTLKIDRSFVQNIDTDEHQAILFKAICDMASALGYEIVAEGVETEGENRVVESYKNIRVQGYYYSKPLESDRLLALLS